MHATRYDTTRFNVRSMADRDRSQFSPKSKIFFKNLLTKTKLQQKAAEEKKR